MQCVNITSLIPFNDDNFSSFHCFISDPCDTFQYIKYLGDWGSRARISGCNIVRNGFGSRRLLSHSTNIEAHTRMLEQGLPLPRDHLPNLGAVPPGHSGVYVESSLCWIDDSLIAGNSLTGLSVVRGGFVSLSGSDITKNGHSAPILIEDAHDINDPARLNGLSIRGGVIEGPEKNNYNTIFRLRVIHGQNLQAEEIDYPQA